MSERLKLFVKVFDRELRKRFLLPKKNAKNESLSNNKTEPLKEKPIEASPHEVELEESEEMDLTEEELEEMELMAEIGDFLDEITGERYEDL